MSTRASLTDERGFTLIELLVAISVGMIVLIATFSIIDHSFSANPRSLTVKMHCSAGGSRSS